MLLVEFQIFTHFNFNTGSASFQLPTPLDELKEILGGEGACVPVGYSLLAAQDGSYIYILFSYIFFLTYFS